MPHTVPNKPTKGAVEPTVARNARPLCRRLPMTSIARCSAMPTQVLRSSCLVCMVPWCSAASELFSATKRNALSSFNAATPSFTECACQNLSSASFASFSILLCSSTLMMPMYQEPTDMIILMIRSEEHTSELQSRSDLVCRLLLEKKKNKQHSPQDR